MHKCYTYPLYWWCVNWGQFTVSAKKCSVQLNQFTSYLCKTTHAQIQNLPAVLMMCELRAIHSFRKENAAYNWISQQVIDKTTHAQILNLPPVLTAWILRDSQFQQKKMQHTIEAVNNLLMKNHACTNTNLPPVLIV